MRRQNWMAGLVGLLVLGAMPAVAAEGTATPPAMNAVTTTVLQLSRWLNNPDDKETIWRYYEAWQTDVCKTDNGELVRVNPWDPRLFQPGGTGDWVSVKSKVFAGYTKEGVYRLKPATRIIGSPPSPAGWEKAEFDDSNWARITGPAISVYRSLSVVCLRGRFEVKDPAQVAGLSLAMSFRGGVVVYLNGKEVGRSNMPEGKITSETLANDYPKEAFILADGSMIAESDREMYYHVRIRPEQKELAERYALRTRTADLKIPVQALSKGVNVLAIEIHRTAAPQAMFATGGQKEHPYGLELHRLQYWWNRVSMDALALKASSVPDAIVSNIARPKGLKVSNQPSCQKPWPQVYGDPNEAVMPIRLFGLKNGAYGGQVVVTASDPVKGLKAAATDLKGPKGGVIPAAAVEIGYMQWLQYDGGWMSLFDVLDPAPPVEVTNWISVLRGNRLGICQPIWVTVNIPKTAPAGAYAGKMTITADGEKPVEVPIEVQVVGDWVLPDPQQFETFAAYAQSPDTLAAQYGVPMWSEEHWKLIGESFRLLGQIGNKEIVLPFLGETHIGNAHAMLHWTRKDGVLTPDFSIVDRYVQTAVKHLGKIPDVCVIFHYGMNSEGGKWVAKPQHITVKDTATGDLKEEESGVPAWGTPEALEFWKPVCEQLQAILKKHGVGPLPTLYATQFSGMDGKSYETLNKLMPGLKAITRTHIGSDWRNNHFYVALMNGSGVYWDPDEDVPWYGWRTPIDIISFPRDAGSAKDWGPGLYVQSDLGTYRLFALETILNGRGGQYNMSETERAKWNYWLNRHGFGQLGGDLWSVLVDGEKDPKKSKSLCLRYNSEGSTGFQCAVFTMLGAGRNGPAPTCRSQMLRESLQEAEARMFIQNALLDRKEKLGADLAKRCQEVCDAQTRMLRYAVEFHYGYDCSPQAIDEQAVKVYRMADEVAKALGK